MTTHARYVMLAAAVALVGGCRGPLDMAPEQELRQSLIESHRRQLQAIPDAPTVELNREPSDVEAELSDERRAELDRISGLAAYADQPVELGDDLMGRTDERVVQLSLQRVMQLAVEHNLDLRVARLRPAIADSQVVQAEAAFDATFFTEAGWQKLDTPQPAGIIPGVGGNKQDENLSVTTGINKRLISGGSIEAATNFNRYDSTTSFFGVSHYYDSDVTLSLAQPLLRNFGSDVNRAEIVLARSARESEAQALRGQLLDLLAQTEQAYWDLVFARHQLLVQKRLHERTVDDRDRLSKRADFDVTPVQITEANSFVELRRGDVIRARQLVRDASDKLKRLINAPDLPVADETLIVPVETPVEDPVQFNLLDAVTTALRQRPEMQQALLAIKDASVRQRVADNLRLPELTLSAAVGFNGLSTGSGDDSYDNLSEADFIDYILSARFSMPIGNRGPQAQYQQTRLQRQSAVLDYQRLAEDVVLAVKTALRTVRTNYELIGSARAARRAAADSLRAIEEQEAAGIALTPEFLLDLKLSTQQRLADAEIQEVAALRDYNSAIAELYRTTGTLLDRNGITFDAGAAE
ncbi:MAG: TolC family protein [Phycisphaeraceae bacterium]|nr:TolC family protein [Phycisphaeraceae bacterium]